MFDHLVPLTLLGGFLSLEATSVGQFMLSRPLVAGTLAGALVGLPGEGFLVGAVLEVYLLVAFPVGGARFPEGASASVVAVAVAAGADGAGLAVGVVTALVWGQLAGLSTTVLRNFNGRLVAHSPQTGGRSALVVVRGHLAALALDLFRGLALTATGIVAGRSAATWVAPWWPLDHTDTRGLLLLGGLVSVGVLLRSFGGPRRRAREVGGGFAVGLVLAWLL